MNNEWQKIETAPKDGRKVLLFFANGRMLIGEWKHGCWLGYPHYGDLQIVHSDATHWQPLPPPPPTGENQ